uniref:Secreted peptide n=1 Tax=Anopheles braziliensis TaxID=58242 RepID=A0A2M3ZM10_9DIPT
MKFRLIDAVVLHSVTLVVTTLGYSQDSFAQLNSVNHPCNAISLGGAFQILPAACVARTPNRSTRASCSIDKTIIHPEYVFLSNNIAVVRLQCPQISLSRSLRIRNVTEGNVLTLMAIDGHQNPVVTPVQVASCNACQDEYEVFDCDRQLCVRLIGIYRSQLRNLDGLSGAPLYATDGQLAGMLSYGFIGAHLVAERLTFHEPFIRHSIEALDGGLRILK